MMHPFLKLVFFVTVTSLLSLAGLSHGSEPECATATHCVLLDLPRWHEDLNEPREARNRRLKEIGDSVDTVTDKLKERAFLVMTANEESRLAQFVDLDWDRCRLGISGWCDKGKSFSVWQLKQMSRAETREQAASEALRRYRQGVNACGTVQGGVAMYATGASCHWKKAASRVATMEYLEAQLRVNAPK